MEFSSFCSYAHEIYVLLGCATTAMGDMLNVPREQGGLTFKDGNVQ
jgi:hypothetical protein